VTAAARVSGVGTARWCAPKQGLGGRGGEGEPAAYEPDAIGVGDTAPIEVSSGYLPTGPTGHGHPLGDADVPALHHPWQADRTSSPPLSGRSPREIP
jgi:hypothetical protein